MRYAWIELNNDHLKNLERTIEGCEIYKSMGVRPVVTSVPGHEYLFEKLPSYILRGLKTAGILLDFNDEAQWKKLAEHIEKVPGESFIFEHETALLDYWFGRKNMLQSKFKKGLAHLNPDKHYIWYPHFHSDGEWVVSHNLQKYMTKSIQSILPHVEFVDSQYIYPENHYWDSEIQGIRDSLARDPTIHIWYPEQTWPRGWPENSWSELILTIEKEKKNKDWIFYPGNTKWVTLAHELKKFVKLPAVSARPK